MEQPPPVQDTNEADLAHFAVLTDDGARIKRIILTTGDSTTQYCWANPRNKTAVYAYVSDLGCSVYFKRRSGQVRRLDITRFNAMYTGQLTNRQFPVVTVSRMTIDTANRHVTGYRWNLENSDTNEHRTIRHLAYSPSNGVRVHEQEVCVCNLKEPQNGVVRRSTKMFAVADDIDEQFYEQSQLPVGWTNASLMHRQTLDDAPPHRQPRKLPTTNERSPTDTALLFLNNIKHGHYSGQ